jgi:hypothetical protein
MPGQADACICSTRPDFAKQKPWQKCFSQREELATFMVASSSHRSSQEVGLCQSLFFNFFCCPGTIYGVIADDADAVSTELSRQAVSGVLRHMRYFRKSILKRSFSKCFYLVD